MISKTGLITPLAKAKGFGSAKEGTHHWWVQRLTALINLPLILWLVWHMVHFVAGADLSSPEAVQEGYNVARSWIAAPLNTILLSVLIVNLCWHVNLGLQVVIEDYVHAKFAKFTSLVLMKLSVVAILAVGLFSVLKIAFGG